MLKKIVSGGQTGVDRAALDIAIKLNIPHGGWCPKGRLAELDTTIPLHYNLQEMLSSEFSERTKRNIIDSDGTLILVPKLPLEVTDGTILTIDYVKERNKPYQLIDISKEHSCQALIDWIEDNHIETLNIAGPRESQSLGIYNKSSEFMSKFLSILLSKQNNENEINDSDRKRSFRM